MYRFRDYISNFKYLTEYDLKYVQDIMEGIEFAIKDNYYSKETETPGSDEDLLYVINNLINIYLSNTKLPTKNDLYLFKSAESLIKHPEILRNMLNLQSIKMYYNNNSSNFTYTTDFNTNYKYAIKEVFNIIKPTLDENICNKIETDTLTENELKLVQNKVLNIIKLIYDKLYNYTIKEGYINKINSYIHILDVIGTLAKNTNKNNSRLKPAHYDFLGFNYYRSQPDTIKRPCMEQLLDPEFVKNFSEEELIALSAFYSNRVAKAAKRYNYCLYILYKTNLLEKYKNDPNYTFDLSIKEISDILMQHKYLSRIAQKYIEQEKKYVTDSETAFYIREINPQNPVFNHALKNYKYDYETEFAHIMPNYDHNFTEDLEKAIELESSSQFAYDSKSHALESLLFMLLEKDKELNWGIILENEQKNSGYFSNKDYELLIGVDMKEFNMPIKFHCSKEDFKNFFANYTGKPIIPIYRGNEDMYVSDIYLSTEIVMKLSKEQRKLLKQSVEKTREFSMYYRFLNHLQWMSHPKRVPEFLPQERSYYDLDKDKIYSKKEYEELESQK